MKRDLIAESVRLQSKIQFNFTIQTRYYLYMSPFTYTSNIYLIVNLQNTELTGEKLCVNTA